MEKGQWRRLTAACLSGALLSWPPLAGAAGPQDPAATTSLALAHGTRVRVRTAGKGRITAYVAELRSEALVVDRPRHGGQVERLTIPRGEIRDLEVSERPSKKGKGALIGMAIGVAGGVALGVLGGDDGCAEDPGPATLANFTARLHSSLCLDKGESALLATLVLAPVLAGLGAAASPGEKWRSVDRARLVVGVAVPRGGGAAVRVSLRF